MIYANGQLKTPQYWDNINDWKLFDGMKVLPTSTNASGDVGNAILLVLRWLELLGSGAGRLILSRQYFVGSFSVDQLNYQGAFPQHGGWILSECYSG